MVLGACEFQITCYLDGLTMGQLYSVKCDRSKEKCIKCGTYFGCLLRTNTILFTILSAIKRPKFDFSRNIILAKLAYLVMLFILQLTHTVCSVLQLDKTDLANNGAREMGFI